MTLREADWWFDSASRDSQMQLRIALTDPGDFPPDGACYCRYMCSKPELVRQQFHAEFSGLGWIIVPPKDYGMDVILLWPEEQSPSSMEEARTKVVKVMNHHFSKRHRLLFDW